MILAVGSSSIVSLVLRQNNGDECIEFKNKKLNHFFSKTMMNKDSE